MNRAQITLPANMTNTLPKFPPRIALGMTTVQTLTALQTFTPQMLSSSVWALGSSIAPGDLFLPVSLTHQAVKLLYACAVHSSAVFGIAPSASGGAP
jgi:hypothetical protein